jgi:hypothetical protein
MSTEPKETLDAILRHSAFPAGSDVNEHLQLLQVRAAAFREIVASATKQPSRRRMV